MILSNNNLSVLPFYTSIGQQNARKWWVYNRVYPFYANASYILPFQIMWNDFPTLPNQFLAELYKPDGTFVSRLSDLEQQIKVANYNNEMGIAVIYYIGALPLVNPLPIGQYYIKLIATAPSPDPRTYVFYSEIFTSVMDLSGYVKIEWWDKRDFVMDGGVIVYNNNGNIFKNILYLESDIAKPEYLFTEEQEDRDGFSFPVKQISEKKYRFSFLASEYLLDVMRFIRMSDYINIYYNGQAYTPDSFLITPEWEDNGDVAVVKAEFETATVAKKIGWGYSRAEGAGDFNNDFNDDYDVRTN